MQRRALRIVYGWECDCEELFESGKVELLKKRREKNLLEFAKKNEQSDRFGRDWFVKNTVGSEREVRNSTRRKIRKYIERKGKTQRMRNNPVNAMARILNDI